MTKTTLHPNHCNHLPPHARRLKLIPPSADNPTEGLDFNMFKVAEYINNFQVLNKDVGIDMGKTLLRAITRTYLERARPEDRPALEKLVQDRIFGTTGAVVFEGKTVPVAQKLDALAARARTAIEKDSGLEVGRADALAAAVGEKQRGGFSDKLKGLLG